MGILLQPLFRLIDAHQLQQLPGTVVRLFLRLIGVQQNDFFDLVADGVHRVQTGHRILEDDGHLVAPDLPEFLLGHLVDLVAVKTNGATHQLAGIGIQTHDGVGRHRFTGPGLSHDPQHIALLHREGHAIQSFHFTGRGEERQALVFDFQQLFAHVVSPFSSSASGQTHPADRRRTG